MPARSHWEFHFHIGRHDIIMIHADDHDDVFDDGDDDDSTSAGNVLVVGAFALAAKAVASTNIRR